MKFPYFINFLSILDKLGTGNVQKHVFVQSRAVKATL